MNIRRIIILSLLVPQALLAQAIAMTCSDRGACHLIERRGVAFVGEVTGIVKKGFVRVTVLEALHGIQPELKSVVIELDPLVINSDALYRVGAKILVVAAWADGNLLKELFCYRSTPLEHAVADLRAMRSMRDRPNQSLLYGRVSDGRTATLLKTWWGEPVSGIRVLARPTGTGEFIETTSDASGYFEFIGLSGDYTLEPIVDPPWIKPPPEYLQFEAPKPGRCAVQNIGLEKKP